MKALWPVLAAALMAGCGRHASPAATLAPAAPVVSKAVPVKLLHDSATVQDPTPAAAPLVATPQALGLSAATGCLGLNACHDGTPLVLQGLDKTKQGLLWRKLHVEGQVKNNGKTSLSGQVTIKFLKKGAVVQTELRTVTNLAAGQALPFKADSNDAADDADVSVSTEGLTTAQTP
jgi:hypothetical protein